MSEQVIEDIAGKIAKAVEEEGIDPSELSLDQLVLLINSERLKTLQDKTYNEFTELKKRQDDVALLHKLIKAINLATNEKGEVDYSSNEEIKGLVEKAKELGVDISLDKTKYNKEERDRLIENIRMTVEDLSVMNDMQMQTISRLTNERYESYQMARSILKPLHDSKINAARGLAGR